MLRFQYAASEDSRDIAWRLDDLVKLRNDADYKLATPGAFRDPVAADVASLNAAALIDLLDAIEADPARRAAVVASIRR